VDNKNDTKREESVNSFLKKTSDQHNDVGNNYTTIVKQPALRKKGCQIKNKKTSQILYFSGAPETNGDKYERV
jgi:hypothetical protein